MTQPHEYGAAAAPGHDYGTPGHRIAPVQVHVVNFEDQILASNLKLHHDVTFRTIVLNAPAAGQDRVGTATRPLCGMDLSREYLVVQALTNDLVLCESQAKAQDPANQVAGLPNPEGFLLKASTGAVFYPPLRIETTDVIWVTAQAFPAIASVMLVNRVRG